MRIIINRTDAIGDTILTMPMAKLIKEKKPEAKIVFIISPRCQDLFKDHPYIDDFWVLDKKSSFFTKLNFLLKKIAEFSPDTYLHVGGSHIPSLCVWYKRLAFRGGLKSKWQTFLFLNKGVRQSRSVVTGHESDYNLDLLSALDIQYFYKNRARYAPAIGICSDEKEVAFEEFKKNLAKEKFDTHKDLIFIHPGMTGHTLNWSSRNYGRLINQIEKRAPDKYLFIISHTPADEKDLVGIKQFLGQENHQDLQGKVYYFNGAIKGLSNYLSILSYAKVFIGPSTGNTHMANALGIKQVGIYSPIKVQSAKRWGPFNRDEKVRVVLPDVVCGEQFSCVKDKCPYYECMGKIEVEDVANNVFALLEGQVEAI